MKTNTQKARATTHEGGTAQTVSAVLELRRTVMTCMLFENTFYEKGAEIAERMRALVAQVQPETIAEIAKHARDKMQLRHVPLFLARELARLKGNGPLVADLLFHIIQRADEPAEFLALYWKDGKQPLSAGVKKGLARALHKFTEYDLAKYDRDGSVKLRDVLFLTHPKPGGAEQEALFKRIAERTLAAPDTWEVALSAVTGTLEEKQTQKRDIFERLLREEKLGGLATLRNLRKMLEVGVDERLLEARLGKGIGRALPFRFVAAARYAPRLERAIERAMRAAVADVPEIDGSTGLLVDVSGSMESYLSSRSEMVRLDAACALAILLSEKTPRLRVATFSNSVVEIPPRKSFALRDAIVGSQPHGCTYLGEAVRVLRTEWRDLNRLVIITDEQAHDRLPAAFTPKAYVINVAPYKNGLSYGNGWTHIDGWSEAVFDFIRLVETGDQ